MKKRFQLRRKEMLRYMRDRLERQLSAVNAALATLEEQIKREQDSIYEENS